MSLSVIVSSGLRSGRKAIVVIRSIGSNKQTPVAAPVISWRNVRIGVRPSIRTMCTAMTAINGKTRLTPSVEITSPAITRVSWL